MRSTGFEFARDKELDRDEAAARLSENARVVLRILQERQHRRWSDAERQRFAGLSERWYRR